jgi:hypothetical protein
MKRKPYAIESGIPVPSVRHASRVQIYPFPRMKIGDSFLVPGTAEMVFAKTVNRNDLTAAQRKARAKYSTVMSAACKFARHHKEYKFCARSVEGGVRVWRIAPKGGNQQ